MVQAAKNIDLPVSKPFLNIAITVDTRTIV